MFLKSFMWSVASSINKLIPKSSRIILLYSGVEYKDNIKAIGDFLFEHGYDCKYKIYLGEYQRKYNYVEIAGKTHKIHGKLASIFIFLRAGYVLYAFNALSIKPSKKQVVFQMWHGMPLKRIFNFGGEKQREYDFFTHILATSPLFAKIISEAVPCSSDKVVICGQPKTDPLKNIVETLHGISRQKMIFWAPTFRQAKYWEQNDADLVSLLPLVADNSLPEFNEFLQTLDVMIIVKLHPMENCSDDLEIKMSNLKIFSHQKFTVQELELYAYLGISSALITDYSSTYIDYLLVNRPIGFTVGNMDEYTRKRGFIFDSPQDYMPGTMIRTQTQLYEFLKSVAAGTDLYAAQRAEINALFNDYDQSKSNCAAVLEYIGVKKC